MGLDSTADLSRHMLPKTEFKRSVSVVVLAAGLSSRMGEQNKLLLPLGGTSVIERALSTITQHPFTEIVVVLGHEAELVEPKTKRFKVKTVVNEHYKEGQMTSVHKGMACLSKPVDGVIVFLADLVLIDSNDLTILRQGFDHCETGILVPMHKQQRGNPIILDHRQQGAVLGSGRNLGCKRLISKSPELVTSLEFPNDHVLIDIDTPQAYQQVVKRIQDTSQNTSSHAVEVL